MKLVIAIANSLTYAARREIQRESWLRQLPHPDVVKVFYGVGNATVNTRVPCEAPSEDVGFLTCPDDYRSLCLKTREMMRFAIAEYDFDYVFKCDDDTFVHVGRLVERAKQAEVNSERYIGRVQGRPPFCEGGAGYLLSRDAAEIIAKADAPAIGMEDHWVGCTLSDGGIVAVHDSRFVQRGTVYPRPDNDQITAHLVRSHTIARNIQKAFEGEISC